MSEISAIFPISIILHFNTEQMGCRVIIVSSNLFEGAGKSALWFPSVLHSAQDHFFNFHQDEDRESK